MLRARSEGVWWTMVARRTDRLEELAAELSGVTVTVIGMDLAQPGAGAKLAAAVAERGITVTSLITGARNRIMMGAGRLAGRRITLAALGAMMRQTERR
jgi:short-subunit dehydrogenase